MKTITVKSTIDKQLDLLTAYVGEKTENPLDTIDDKNILYFVDSVTNELIMIQIYDFSVFKKQLFKDYIWLLTKKQINKWIQTIADSFQASTRYKHNYAS